MVYLHPPTQPKTAPWSPRTKVLPPYGKVLLKRCRPFWGVWQTSPRCGQTLGYSFPVERRGTKKASPGESPKGTTGSPHPLRGSPLSAGRGLKGPRQEEDSWGRDKEGTISQPLRPFRSWWTLLPCPDFSDPCSKSEETAVPRARSKMYSVQLTQCLKKNLKS